MDRKEQFERVKRKYGFHKNIKKEDWRYIESVVRQRGANGKVSVVIVHGKRISEERLHRGIQRHSYEPVYERAKRCKFDAILKATPLISSQRAFSRSGQETNRRILSFGAHLRIRQFQLKPRMSLVNLLQRTKISSSATFPVYSFSSISIQWVSRSCR